MTGSSTYAQLMADFEALSSASDAERRARLDEIRADDPDRARQLERLLAADARTASPLDDAPPLLSDRPVEATPSEEQDHSRPDPAQLGEVLGGYRLQAILGSGGMGCVFRGVHEKLGREAAIKVLHTHLAHDPDLVSRFFYEAKIANDVRHPHIVDVFDFLHLRDPLRVACVMELLPGPTLSEVIRQDSLTLPQAVAVCLQLCDALAAVHAQGVVHRDLKPDNIMVVGSLQGELGVPSIKVLDFGIAKVSDAAGGHRTLTGAILGTPAYMAPEQIAGEAVTAAADVYAVGEIFYELVTGRPAFRGRGIDLMSRKLRVDAVAQVLPEGLPDAARALVQDCLRLRPEVRPSLADVRSRLEALAESPEVSAAMAGEARFLSGAKRGPHRLAAVRRIVASFRPRWKLVATFAALAALAGGLVAWGSRVRTAVVQVTLGSPDGDVAGPSPDAVLSREAVASFGARKEVVATLASMGLEFGPKRVASLSIGLAAFRPDPKRRDLLVGTCTDANGNFATAFLAAHARRLLAAEAAKTRAALQQTVQRLSASLVVIEEELADRQKAERAFESMQDASESVYETRLADLRHQQTQLAARIADHRGRIRVLKEHLAKVPETGLTEDLSRSERVLAVAVRELAAVQGEISRLDFQVTQRAGDRAALRLRRRRLTDQRKAVREELAQAEHRLAAEDARQSPPYALDGPRLLPEARFKRIAAHIAVGGVAGLSFGLVIAAFLNLRLGWASRLDDEAGIGGVHGRDSVAVSGLPSPRGTLGLALLSVVTVGGAAVLHGQVLARRGEAPGLVDQWGPVLMFVAALVAVGAVADTLTMRSERRWLHSRLTRLWRALRATSVADLPLYLARPAERALETFRTAPVQTIIASIPTSILLTGSAALFGRVMRSMYFPDIDPMMPANADLVARSTVQAAQLWTELDKYAGALVVNWVFDVFTVTVTLVLVARLARLSNPIARAFVLLLDLLAAVGLAVGCLWVAYLSVGVFPSARWALDEAARSVMGLISLRLSEGNPEGFDDAFFAGSTLIPSILYLASIVAAIVAKAFASVALNVSTRFVGLATEPAAHEVDEKFRPFVLLGLFLGLVAFTGALIVQVVSMLA